MFKLGINQKNGGKCCKIYIREYSKENKIRSGVIRGKYDKEIRR